MTKHQPKFGNFRLVINVLLLIATVAAGAALADRRERLIDSWQPVHFEVKIAFDKELSRLDSAVTDITVLVLKNDVSKIDLDFGKMPVSAVSVDNAPVRFVQQDGKLDVMLAAPAQQGRMLTISVTYSGVPEDGLILTKDKDGNPSAIGDNWADRVHNWIPCLDHPSAKASVRFTVTAPADDPVVANGAMESVVRNADATKTWIYNETKPISPYNMVVVAGRFATATLNANAPVPISYYVTQSSGKFAEQAFSPAAPSVLTFSNLIAPYPYKKLALIVGATKFGGMENANTIVFMPDFFDNFLTAKTRSRLYNIPSWNEEVIAHEIAHQWFGDSVTEKTWADLWLSEGFATYFAGLFLEKNEGPEVFRSYMKDKAKRYLDYEKKRRAPIYDTQTEKLFDLLNPNNYEKGAWVLHGLRGLVGDKAFFAGLRDYYELHKESTASTEDLRTSLEKSSGKDLKAYFARWVYGAGHPIYKISWKPLNDGTVQFTLRQFQQDEAFLEPVTVKIVADQAESRFVITPQGKETVIAIKTVVPKKVVVDPDEFILKEVVD